MMVDSGLQVGRYLLDRRLGSGGMGEVFLAYSPAGDPVAVKLIRSDRLDPLTRARFEVEADIARTLVGTSRVARFLEADPFAERPWLAVEYVRGVTLADHVEEHGPLPEALVASLGALLAEALTAVHEVGLLHRDVKPQNVILGRYGPVLIDFGLGAFLDRPAEPGQIVGTIRYMPPEQAGAVGSPTPAADVYALGGVLVFAATGHAPFDGPNWEAIAARVRGPAEPPDLDGLVDGLLPLVSAMLDRDPASRPTPAVVTATCARQLAELDVTPVQAREQLIARTATQVEIPVPPPRLPDELEESPVAVPSDDEPPAPPINRNAVRVAEDLRRRYAAGAAL